jgi:hypothetical protein
MVLGRDMKILEPLMLAGAFEKSKQNPPPNPDPAGVRCESGTAICPPGWLLVPFPSPQAICRRSGPFVGKPYNFSHFDSYMIEAPKS